MNMYLTIGAAMSIAVAVVAWPRLQRLLSGAKKEPRVRRASESTFAREKAERDLESIRRDGIHYAALAHDLRMQREQNHFAESIARSMQVRGT